MICPKATKMFWVYPRVRGGNLRRDRAVNYLDGLSPRARGKLWLETWRKMLLGSIPACAGETGVCSLAFFRSTVYPRVRGGNAALLSLSTLDVGLSPRARGKPLSPGRAPTRRGSIPACAGETRIGEYIERQGRVYPRVRGGNYVCGSMHQGGEGLSPRARGKPSRYAAHRPHLGSIPACAGETDHFGAWSTPATVYPRVRGGNISSPFRIAA